MHAVSANQIEDILHFNEMFIIFECLNWYLERWTKTKRVVCT